MRLFFYRLNNAFFDGSMQFGHGQSNPTYLLQVELHGAVQRYVLRKKPPGHILQSAHAVEREYQVFVRIPLSLYLILFLC